MQIAWMIARWAWWTVVGVALALNLYVTLHPPVSIDIEKMSDDEMRVVAELRYPLNIVRKDSQCFKAYPKASGGIQWLATACPEWGDSLPPGKRMSIAMREK